MFASNFFATTGILIISNSAAFVTAMLAALFWYRSARAEVQYEPSDGAAVIIVHEDGRRVDPFASAALANKWNSRAAACAAFSVVFQAFTYFWPERNDLIYASVTLWNHITAFLPLH